MQGRELGVAAVIERNQQVDVILADAPQQLVWTRELINRFWDGVSQTRLTELSFSRVNGETLIGFIGDHLAPGTRCLDFGAGDGSLLRLLVEHGCPTAAYEPSNERSAQIAGESLADNPLYLGTVGAADEGSFDVIIAAEVVEHVLDEEIVFGTARVLVVPEPTSAFCLAIGGLLLLLRLRTRVMSH